MGYCFDYRGRLVCDKCCRAGDVRRRKCPYKVDGLHYCYPPALCADCYKELGGLRGLHGDKCRDGAAASQARSDAEAARIADGDMQPAAAWGDWKEGVPDGMVGVLYRGADREAFYLLPKDVYQPKSGPHPWFSEVAEIAEIWEDNPDAKTKEVRV